MKKQNKKQRKKKLPSTRMQVSRKKELSIGREAKYVVDSAQRSEARVVTLGNLVFFSTVGGDAWVLDPEDSLALQLAALGEPLPYRILETPATFTIEWNARYAVSDSGFTVLDSEGKVKVFSAYPVEHIRDAERRTSQSS